MALDGGSRLVWDCDFPLPAISLSFATYLTKLATTAQSRLPKSHAASVPHTHNWVA